MKKIINFLNSLFNNKKCDIQEYPTDNSIESINTRLSKPVNIKYSGTSWSVKPEEAYQRALDVLNKAYYEILEEKKQNQLRKDKEFQDFLNNGKINE